MHDEHIRYDKEEEMRWPGLKHANNPIVTRWETKAAEFLQIEISPSHTFRIRIDKNIKKENGGESA